MGVSEEQGLGRIAFALRAVNVKAWYDAPVMEPTPMPTPDEKRTLKIVVGVALGCVTVCGLLGSCLLLVTLIAPFLTTGP
jgi:hypothetical protein